MRNLLVIFVILCGGSAPSQNFPYLNASTGNPDFFTDKDTNMFMIHGNRIAKLDKNFGPVWVKTYGNVSFKNVLLSKTGSMYFIAGSTATASDIIGKIEPNGNLSWARSTAGMTLSMSGSTVTAGTMSCSTFFLDSNNSLLLSGAFSYPANAALFKLDTLGNVTKARGFDLTDFLGSGSVKSVNVLNESSGQINLVAVGAVLDNNHSAQLETFAYSDAGDAVIFTNTMTLAYCNNCSMISSFYFGFYKSKTRSDVFYIFGSASVGQNQWNSPNWSTMLGKYTMSSALWMRKYRWTAASMDASALDEDEKGNVFAVSRSYGYFTPFHSGFVKFDSTGAYDGNWVKYFSAYNPNNNIYPNDRINAIRHGRYFMSVVGGGYPDSPVTTETISPALSMYCSTVQPLIEVGSGSGAFGNCPLPPQYTITSVSMNTTALPVTAVSGFSVIQNFCLTQGLNELDPEAGDLVYPNPASDKIFIGPVSYENKVSVYDQTGNEVYRGNNVRVINISGLSPGIYLLRLKTGKGTITQKIVKE